MQAFDSLWNYNQPAETEAKFRALLPTAGAETDPNYYPELLSQIGRTLGLQQKFTEAHAILDEAKAHLNEQTAVAQVRYQLERGRLFNSSNDKDAARPYFEQAWDLARQIKAEFYAVDAAHMLAIVSDGEPALQWHLDALAYAEQCTEERVRHWRGALYNNMGWTYHEMGRYDEAHDMFVKALRAREEQGDEALIHIAQWCIGRVMRSLGRLHEALTIQHDLEIVYQELGEESGYTLEEVGECLYALGETEEAKPYFAKAYAVLSQDIWLCKNEPDRLARLQALS